MAFALVAHSLSETNVGLTRAWRGAQSYGVLTPMEALRLLGPGDTALARLDVRPGLDGPESGLAELDELERRGVRVLNGAQLPPCRPRQAADRAPARERRRAQPGDAPV